MLGQNGLDGQVKSVNTGLELADSLQPSYINRELSWLKFNWRVLQLAEDQNVPTFERLKYLAIFATNLDEFFMKRIGGLQRHLWAGLPQSQHDLDEISSLLSTVRQILQPQLLRAEYVYHKQLIPLLLQEGIELVGWNDLSSSEQELCKEHYQNRVYPLLTPLAADIGQPFPFISNLSSSLGILLAGSVEQDSTFVRIKTSDLHPQWLHVNPHSPKAGYRLIHIRNVVEHFLPQLFPDDKVLSCTPFRVTRSIALEIDEEDASDLRELMEDELRQRRMGRAIRLELKAGSSHEIRDILRQNFQLQESDIYEVKDELDYSSLSDITSLPLSDLKYRAWSPVTAPPFQEEESIFSTLKRRDVLVHHPYEGFSSSVERLIREAAEDPQVKSIKIALYRIGKNSTIVPLLIKAVELGKNVVCLIEVRARFDERNNLTVARELEDAGVHVICGLPKVKVHAKALLVTREEGNEFSFYAHLGTGNYHSLTANLYTDMSLFTSNREICGELVQFFNFLTGRTSAHTFDNILVAPLNMSSRFETLINREIENVQQGRAGQIIAKMNSLESKMIIDLLYKASTAGVKIKLFVRGICCIIPGLPGMSENISVVSVVGRFLEHSRIFYFQNGAEDPINGDFYLGSADWMARNLNRRVELVVPINNPENKALCWQHLQILDNDRCDGWDMQSDGSYERRYPTSEEELSSGTHETMMQLARKSSTA